MEEETEGLPLTDNLLFFHRKTWKNFSDMSHGQLQHHVDIVDTQFQKSEH